VGTGPSLTIGELIERYRREYSASYGRTVGKDLELLARSKLARISVGNLKSGDIVAHIKARVEGYTKGDGGQVRYLTSCPDSTSGTTISALAPSFSIAPKS